MTTPSPLPAVRPCAALLAFAVMLVGCAAAPTASEPAPADPSAQPAESGQTSSTSPISEDLDGLLAALERSHPEPFHGVPREEFVAALDAYEASLPEMTPDESVVELMRAEEHPDSLTVLTDRVTFSAAANLATEIEGRTDATFVGEAMGGGLNFWDDVGWVDLDSLPVPMRAAVSLRYWEFAEADDPRLTIEPDVWVPVAATDFFAGRDPALEVALRGED